MLRKWEWNFWRQLVSLSPVFVNGYLSGYHLFWLSSVTYYFTQPGHIPSATLTECGYIGSFLELGRLISCFPCGIMVDRFGRKKTVFLAGILNLISTTTFIFSHDLVLIYVARFVSGIALSLVACSSTPLIGEISSPKFRGTFFSVFQIMKLASPVLQTAVGVIFSSYRAMTIAAALVSINFFISAYFLLESPYFLITSGKSSDAKRNFRILHPDQNEKQINDQFDEMAKSIVEENSKSCQLNRWQFFKQKAILKATFLGIIIRGFPSFQGVLTMISFLTIILPENDYLPNVYYPLIASVLNLIGQTLTTAIIERFPRRELYFYSTLICFVSSFFFGIVYQLAFEKYNQVWRWMVIGGIMLFVSLQATLCLTLSEIVSSELFPARIRGQASALSLIGRAISNVIGYQLFDSINAYFGIFANFYLYGIAFGAALFIIHFFQPETRGKSLSQVQNDMRTKGRDEPKI